MIKHGEIEAAAPKQAAVSTTDRKQQGQHEGLTPTAITCEIHYFRSICHLIAFIAKSFCQCTDIDITLFRVYRHVSSCITIRNTAYNRAKVYSPDHREEQRCISAGAGQIWDCRYDILFGYEEGDSREGL